MHWLQNFSYGGWKNRKQVLPILNPFLQDFFLFYETFFEHRIV